jgi:hypothetical protein
MEKLSKDRNIRDNYRYKYKEIPEESKHLQRYQKTFVFRNMKTKEQCNFTYNCYAEI